MSEGPARHDAGEPWPALIVGAGAAGMLAAIFAARGGARVLVLETRRVPGAKIRVSGGGRCNVLPSRATLEDYHTSGSPKAMRNVLFSWPLDEVQRFFAEDLGVPLKVEPTGKMFPVSDRAKDVVDALLAAMRRAGVTLRGEARATALRRVDGGFEVQLAGGETLRARRVLLAAGGLSLPKTGSDGAGWRMARALGHTVLPTSPALVPLLTPEPRWHALAGLSLDVELAVRRGGRELERRRGDFLFTHTGFSGPVALDVSRHFTVADVDEAQLVARWAPDVAWEAELTRPEKRLVASVLRERLPRRLADTLLERAALPVARATSELSRDERLRLLVELEACDLAVRGNEGYRTAEVTAGGVPLEEVSVKTLESRRVPGLYLAGEMLDVTGRIGGFNFLWAWVSGRKAGLAMAQAAALEVPSEAAAALPERSR